MNVAFLTLGSLVIGAVLGLFSSVLLADRNHKLALQMKLVDCFLTAREEIAALAARLAFMDVRGPVVSHELIEQRLQISDLYYRHYGFIPIEVFESLHLLYAAMSNHSGRLYKIDGDTLVPMPKIEESAFIHDVALFRNVRLHATMALGSADRQIRHRQAVKLHAQYVLNVINSFASLEWAERRSRALGHRNIKNQKPRPLAD